jgi:positive phototaxis protein PixI
MVSDFLSTGLRQSEPHEHQRAKVGQQFLRFHLLPDTTALLAVQRISEILTVPLSQVVPIPHLQPWVMGVYNWRGEILWMVDLGYLIGLAPIHQQRINRSHYQVLVIHSGQQISRGQGQANQTSRHKMLGVVVNQVEEMEWFDPGLIQSPPGYAVTPELVPYLRGYLLKANGDMSVVLDGEAIIAGMSQASLL